MAFGLAGAIIGGGLGLISSMNQADAISSAGQNTQAASDRATQAQQDMFNSQQANQNAKYQQVRGDLSSLFGGNVNQNLTGANPGAGITSGGMNADQLRQLLLPHFTTGGGVDPNNPTAWMNWMNQTGDTGNWAFGGSGAGTVDEAGLNAAIQQIMAQQQQQGSGASGVGSGSIFGAGTGINNPQLQAQIAALQGTGSAFGQTALGQLNQFNSFNPSTMAQDIYNKLSALGQPAQQLARSNLESRLLNQGILTSSPGYNQINSMDQANGQEDLARQIQAMTTAQAQQQQFLANATSAAGTQGNMATTGQNIQNAALAPALQAAGIEAGVPINSAQPIPSGALSVAGAQAAGQANVNAANITNSFWNSLGQNQALQQGVSNLFTPQVSGGVPINTSGTDYNGSAGLFAQINGYGGGV